MLQRVLRGPIIFTPRADGQGYDFEAPTRFEKLFVGVACIAPAWADCADLVRDRGRGLEHLGTEDIPDADYGRLLELAYMKGVVRPAGLDPFTVVGSVLRRAA